MLGIRRSIRLSYGAFKYLSTGFCLRVPRWNCWRFACLFSPTKMKYLRRREISFWGNASKAPLSRLPIPLALILFRPCLAH